jgi:hypothetical protein
LQIVRSCNPPNQEAAVCCLRRNCLAKQLRIADKTLPGNRGRHHHFVIDLEKPKGASDVGAKAGLATHQIAAKSEQAFMTATAP